MKNYFWGAGPFLREDCIWRRKLIKLFLGCKSLLKRRGRLAMKINITLFMENEVLNILSNNFSEESEKKILGYMTVMRTKGYLTPKLSIIFFMGEFLNIFLSNKFFDDSNIFQENVGKKFFEGGMTIS